MDAGAAVVDVARDETEGLGDGRCRAVGWQGQGGGARGHGGDGDRRRRKQVAGVVHDFLLNSAIRGGSYGWRFGWSLPIGKRSPNERELVGLRSSRAQQPRSLGLALFLLFRQRLPLAVEQVDHRLQIDVARLDLLHALAVAVNLLGAKQQVIALALFLGRGDASLERRHLLFDLADALVALLLLGAIA